MAQDWLIKRSTRRFLANPCFEVGEQMSPTNFSHILDRLAVLSSAATLFLGCSTLGPEATLPDGAIAFEPPAAYSVWWEETEACADIESDMGRVLWIVVPNVRTFPTESGEKVGYWSRTRFGTQIILAGEYRDHALVVRHEILHELLGREGHPDDYFRVKCQLTWDTYPEADLAVR